MKAPIELICVRALRLSALCLLSLVAVQGCTADAGGPLPAGSGGTGAGGSTSSGSGQGGSATPGTGGTPTTGAGGSADPGGRAGASGSTGVGGASVPGGDAGAPDRARDGGVGPGGGAGASGTDGGTGVGGPSQCTPGRYLICEDFEATAVGAVPTGWTKHGNAAVAADQAARGTHSLKIEAANSGERRIYIDAAKLGSGHWGRIFYRVQLPVPTVFVHSTIVALQGVGPVNGNEEVRVVDTVKQADGTHQFLYNVQPSGNEFGKGSAYNWRFDGAWHCAEWHIDNPTQSYHFYFDNIEVTQIAINNGAGKFAGSDIPPIFSQVHIGWNNYQSAPPGFVAWVDEVAIDTNRIGCSN
jgi:hypothetical protein